jgi:phosphoribosylamine--glycine ligase
VTEAAGVPTHRWRAFADADAAVAFYRTHREPWWIKADGLAAGKGAVLPESIEAGENLLRDWLSAGALGAAGLRVVIEEPLRGREASVIALVSGTTVRCLPACQDHKRLGDDDTGPNTGGMGAFGPTPSLGPVQLAEIEQTFFVPTLREMERRGIDVRGVLYAGLMLTENGPRLLEYNTRFGDPEAQVLMWLIENDLVDLIEATIDGSLGRHEIEAREGAAVVVVGAAAGYPAVPRGGDVVHGLDDARAALGDRGIVFHAGTRREESAIVTAGGRVLGVSAIGRTIAAAADLAYDALDRISWSGMQTRRDIGRSIR